MTLWLTTDAFARLRCVTRRRAQQVLAGWQRDAERLAALDAAGVLTTQMPPPPRTRIVTGGRGRPALHVLAADVAQLYALSDDDVHQLAA